MKESFEEMVSRYREELMRYSNSAARTVAEPAVAIPTERAPESPTQAPAEETALNDTGFLQISLSTARQSLPLEDGLVTVTRIDANGNSVLLYVLRTDISGRAPTVSLPAPPRLLSESPGSARPFALYDIRAERAEYVGQSIRNIHIFGGVTSNMAVEMVPTLLPAATVPDTEIILSADGISDTEGA